MSILTSTSRVALPTELSVLAHSMLHTSASTHAQRKFGLKRGSNSSTPSRTRLVNDLKPRGDKGKGRLEVALKQPSFVRESAPHPEGRDNRERRPFQFGERGAPIRTLKRGERRPSFDASYRRKDPREWEDKGEWKRKKSRQDRSEIPGSLRDRREHRPTDESTYRNRGQREWTDRKTREDPALQNAVPESLRTSGGLPHSPEVNLLPKIVNPLSVEFDLASKAPSMANLPMTFKSPPLLEGLAASVHSILGPSAKPTPIQALSLKHLFSPLKTDEDGKTQWRQYLLASETGSGKSIAYLLPMLQDVKTAELRPPTEDAETALAAGADAATSPQRALNPRALVLAPTHELSRQLSGFAKSLLHNVKLRVLCASRANVPSSGPAARRNASASEMAGSFDGQDGDGEFLVSGKRIATDRDVDVLVGTPTKMLEMTRGRGWDWERRTKEREEREGKEEDVPRRQWTIGEPEAALANVEWVVIDEADVLLDPDFQESTRMLLADIAAARGHPVHFQPELNLSSTETTVPEEIPDYPFNLLLTTATIPASLATYLDAYHPSLTRLASPNLHRLPHTLKTEYEGWTGGRRNKDIERKIRRIWWEDAVAAAKPGDIVSAETIPAGSPQSKILIFCNKSIKVEDLGKYLTEMGVPNVALTSTSETRQRGNNHHLDGFLRVRDDAAPAEDPDQPHVLITTSLLSRGLDFSPSIKHVFIVDSPRNMVDFLHRAGRSGRAGEKGKVIVFGKEKGRGAGRDNDMKRRVKALAR